MSNVMLIGNSCAKIFCQICLGLAVCHKDDCGKFMSFKEFLLGAHFALQQGDNLDRRVPQNRLVWSVSWSGVSNMGENGMWF